MLQKYKSEFRFQSFYLERLNSSLRCKAIFEIVVLSLSAGLMVLFQSCKKMVEIPPPEGSISTSQTFSTDNVATAAMDGVYHKMINVSSDAFANSAITIYTGASSDELILSQLSDVNAAQFVKNSLTSVNTVILNGFWSSGYSIIYGANSVIAGIKESTNLSDSVKKELTAEAKFVRAFCDFYLVNLFGDIPLVNEINWRNTSTLSRSSIPNVYQQILSDLKDAESNLQPDYSVGKGQRIVPNQAAATAMLAKVYLYLSRWSDAEAQATNLISNSALYNLKPVLTDVFKSNSSETIWQLQQSNQFGPSYNATREGWRLIPLNSTTIPSAYLSSYLLASFEANDKRKTLWVDSSTYAAVKYYYPKKYKIGVNQRTAGGPYTEYYMVLRLAEQYLIRAEARVQQNNLSGAIDDINVIRSRAGLPTLPNNGSLTQAQVIAAVQQENRIEFFAEWGHRWLDLKRWKLADAILESIKGSNWQTSDQLYPIPASDLATDPNLIQNPNY